MHFRKWLFNHSREVECVYMTTDQFAELLKLKSVVTVQRMCRSREWRKNKLARKIGKQWRIDVERYQKWWAGELK